MKKYTTIDDLFRELEKDPEVWARYKKTQLRYVFLQWLVDHHLGWLMQILTTIFWWYW